MNEKFNEVIKIRWWEHFPVLGTMVYGVRVEWFLNEQDKKFRKATKRYVGIYRLIGFLIGISFLTTFFIIRNKYGFGSWPWPFWVGLSFGLSSNLTPLIIKALFIKGFNKFNNEKNSTE